MKSKYGSSIHIFPEHKRETSSRIKIESKSFTSLTHPNIMSREKSFMEPFFKCLVTYLSFYFIVPSSRQAFGSLFICFPFILKTSSLLFESSSMILTSTLNLSSLNSLILFAIFRGTRSVDIKIIVEQKSFK